MSMLAVLTINLWGDQGPAAARMEALAGWLRAGGPDVVLLQEVEQVDGRGQAELLADAAGYRHVVGVRTGRASDEGEGLAVLSRHPMTALAPVRLPGAASDHPRSLQQVDVATAGGAVRVGNTHLAWRLDATAVRLRQVEAILAALPADRPTLIGGDLNDVPGSAPLDALARAGFADCCTRSGAKSTFDRANPHLWQPELAGRRVDHLLGRGLELRDARVVLDGVDGPVVSDHYGVRASLLLPGPG